ncbi:MAG: DUF4296 domain-containing protein [Bacteroidetes bacterium]|nr:MAG: DUF4296 domain-containing protein [Bacteroidota bacterium]
MKNKFGFLIVLIFSIHLLACKDSKIIIPPDVLSKEELVPILTDIQIAQASRTIFEYSDTVSYSLNDYRIAILKQKNIPEDKFESSMKFYSENPELLQEIYNEVVNELSRKQGELEK